MAEELLDFVRTGYAAWNDQDFSWFEENMTEDCEFHPIPELFPDVEERYDGLEGWRKFWDVFRSAWSSIEIEIDRLDQISDHEAFAIVRFDGVGAGSGVLVSLSFAHWFTVRDGKLAKLVVESPEDGERHLAERG